MNGSNRVSVTQAITLQSVNGPSVTFINGYQMPVTTNGVNSIRCVYLASGATLSGFTLTNGSTYSANGGGICCQSSSAIVSNCVITGNSTLQNGAGAYFGTYINCIFIGNIGYGSASGGGIANAYLTNCLIAGNSAYNGGGANFPAALVNCTVVNNNATYGGGVYTGGGGAYAGFFRNSIICFNNAVNGNPFNNTTFGSNVYNFASSSISNCCAPEFHISGCISNMPGLMGVAFGDCHLQIGSPGIDTGDSSYVSTSYDLDGNPRIFGASVDMGAYENQFSGIAHFVNLASQNPTLPYTNWLTAATNIQDAIDVANLGEPVVVSNGLYRTGGRVVYDTLTNRVVIDKPITVESLNGPAATFIVGNWTFSANAVRCVYMTNSATLAGFTLTNGASGVSGNIFQSQSGGGVWSESTNTLIEDCVIRGNTAAYHGGGAYSGTLTNCLIFGNQVSRFGGGTAFSTLVNCTVSNNIASTSGGGASGGFLTGCLLISNNASFGGGTSSNILIKTTLTGNWATKSGGGSYYSSLTNCFFNSNHATNGYGGGALYGTLTGCTLTNNGASSGGGSCSNVLNNCSLVFNGSTNGGGLYYGTAVSCLFSNNGANLYGGGSFAANLTNCILALNVASASGAGSAWGISSGCVYSNNLSSSYGGGVFSNTAVNCIFTNNVAVPGGAGGYGSTLNGCWIVSNQGGGAYYSILNNCVLMFNYQGSAARYCTLNNCTIRNNIWPGTYAALYCYATNCIIYNNNPNYNWLIIADQAGEGDICYCCTTPLPPGSGNFTNAPVFLDWIHQSSNSPCIDAGNNSYAVGSVDFDGRPRIVNGTVDVGASEFQGASIEPFIVWLAQYNLPNDGSADYLDSDGDGLNNWLEWIAGTNPIDVLSVLKMNSVSNSLASSTVTWQSVTNVTYYLQRSTNLPAFTSIQSNLVGQAGSTSYSDTTATNGGSYFYRVGVQ